MHGCPTSDRFCQKWEFRLNLVEGTKQWLTAFQQMIKRHGSTRILTDES